MKCTGCGSKIPFSGDVCGFCLRDKSSDQTATVATAIGLVIGGFVGNLAGGFGGMIVGGLVLGIVAAVLAAIMSAKNHSAKKPPRVRVDPATATIPTTKPRPVAVTASNSVEDRLRRLDRLKTEGLLSDEEHDVQRRAIIAAL